MQITNCKLSKNGINLSVAFQDAEDNHFSCRTATASAFTPSAEIAFVQLDGTLENLIGSQGQMMADNHTDFAVGQDGGVGLNVQNIGSGTGSNLEYKKFEQFLLNVVMDDAKSDTLMTVIKQKIMPDSIVYTDSLSSYNKPGVSGFIHYRINNQRSFSQAASSTAPFFTAAVAAVAISAYGRF